MKVMLVNTEMSVFQGYSAAHLPRAFIVSWFERLGGPPNNEK